LLLITVDDFSGGTNIDDLERPGNRKIVGLSTFFAILGFEAHLDSKLFADITGDRPRQPEYVIKMMLSPVS